MKFKPKHALAAVALAIAGQASAQVIHDLPSTGNSSMYFLALDEAAGRSYFAEMVANAGSTTVGILHMDDLVSNPSGTWTVTLSGLNTFAGVSTAGNLFGGFGGADTTNVAGGGSTPATGSRRILTSSATGAAPAFTNSQLVSANSGGGNYTSYVGQIAGECPTGPCIATSTSQAAYAGIQNASFGIGMQWGFPSGSNIGTALTGTIAWDIYLAVSNSSTALGLAQASTVTMSALHAVLDLASNVLTISGPSAVVPVPAAVWLLGSAMLGFMGIGRRKKGQAADDAAGAVAA